MSIGRTSSPTEGKTTGSSGTIMPEDDAVKNDVTIAATKHDNDNSTTTTTTAVDDDDVVIPSSKKEQQQLPKKQRTAVLLTSILLTALLLSIGWLIQFHTNNSSSAAAAADKLLLYHTSEKEESQEINKKASSSSSIVSSPPPPAAAQSSLKKHKNANRGIEGTVVKSMNRGYPLNVYLEEDLSLYEDDSSSDDDEEEEEEEESLEESVNAGEEKKDEEEQVMDIMKKKGDTKQHARVWESNDEAVLKIKVMDDKKKEEEMKKMKMMGRMIMEDMSSSSSQQFNTEELMKVVKNLVLEQLNLKEEECGKEEEKIMMVMEELSREIRHMKERELMKTTGVNDVVVDDDSTVSSDDSSDDDDDSSDDDDDETTKPNEQSTTTTTTITNENKNNDLLLPNLSTLSPTDAAQTILNGISTNLQDRLSTMFTKAKTHECRAKIAEHFALFVNGLAMETKFPFQDWYYPSTCTAIPYYENWADLPPNVNAHDLHHRVYQPPRDSVPEGTYIEKVEDLELVYVILTHDQPESTIRLIESVYVENRTKFVVHVDGKEQADETFHRLMQYAQEKNEEQRVVEGGGEYIRLVPNKNRVRVNWGGFSMVNATLVAMKTLFGLDYYDEHPDETTTVPGHDNPHAFSFHKMIHLASTTYPLASNTEIRDTLASYPLDANFMHILLQPNDPTPQVWNYFVECDDALHRIYRLPPLTIDKGHGIDIHTSSQWFIISREFAWYLAKPPKNSLVDYLLDYMEHVVVADESFFGTVLRNTHFCSTLHNDNFLHIQFGSWENESKAANERDSRKCVMRNPDHCGRSPTTMTLDYLPVLELSGDLFARKFDDVAEPLVKDYIDKRRKKEEERFLREEVLAKEIEANKTAGVDVTEKLPLESWEFQGEGVMLVARETVLDDVPLCLGLKADGANRVFLTPCFKEDVPPTLSPDWYTGAVIIEEIEHFNRWDIGPCSSDGELKRDETTGELEMTPGEYSQTGPKCMLKVGDGIRKGRCLDVESTRTKPGAYLNIYPCEAKWHQLFSFGNGDIVPRGGVHVSPPKHILTKDSAIHLCLGVQGRSDEDEDGWLRPEHDDDPNELWPWDLENATEYYESGFKSLKYWDGIQLQTTPCSNRGAVVEFLYVPFIVEEYDKTDEGEPTDSKESDADVTEKMGVEESVVVGDEL
ncbi:hypothetical protein ACHAXM_004281 [Skeletonema potamos]